MKKETILCVMVMLTISTIIYSETEEMNTIFGNAEIVKCPYCGTKKELMNIGPEIHSLQVAPGL